ncbi:MULTISPECIES: type VI secretion protein IcmF/TssM N-terminal domain-containing protein [unclassified Brenneria]|uniref:type VI secretion protein IcmF/TssM N-terminal domain-containing protein n=1 Tax=unclassified Brenneria TaxID=2634434 RepID=UPI0018F09162|nr:type VI secretion protein IcmF/TssM N-terminal domain-containing protein [Brenneria sp. L3-3C-1]MBJ7223518.1 hypothetical protein [Brenneria sp. L3-3C-1]MEE3644759.1 type VI secretion protein IcmF/TssM N-terminal domain-containing protein [Brenneria sp. L3_3C_1]
MKVLLRVLKGFWFLLAAFWLAAMLACWFLLPHWVPQQDGVWVAMALVTAFCLLLIVLRQYRRIRAEHNIENLVQLEMDRSVGAQSEFRDQQVLRERLRHAIALLRTARAASGGGSSALYDLPWYLVLGMSASGKTSLLTRSGLSATVAGGKTGLEDGGTQHCDWYFSPEAVLIDTAGRYLMDDQSAGEFTDFLRLLRRQRRKPAINGLVLVVSLPELVQDSPEERQRLAERLVTRIEEYTACLGVNPPIYLVLSKADLLPGFEPAFGSLDAAARQQPLGITFALSELHQGGARKALEAKFLQLLASLGRHVDGQLLGQGGRADGRMLNFPGYIGELSGVLGGFLEHFEQAAQGRATPVLRGLYFTSALQAGHGLPPLLDEATGERFSLQPAPLEGEAAEAERRGDRSYFITDTFRRVIFPDRDLSLYYSRQGRRKSLAPALTVAALLAGVALLAWEGTSFYNNRLWLADTSARLHTIGDRGQAGGEALEFLRERLAELETHRRDGVPLGLAAGLYSGGDLRPALRDAYRHQLQVQVLEPIGRDLQLRLRALNDFTQEVLQPEPEGTAAQGAAPQRSAREAARQGVSAAGSQLARGTLPRGLSDVSGRARGVAQDVATQGRQGAIGALREQLREASASEETVRGTGLALSDEVLARLDEHQLASLIEAYNALKLYLVLSQPEAHPEDEFVADALPTAWLQAVSGDALSVEPERVREHVALYLDDLRNGEARALRRNEQLVEQARNSLKSFMIASSLVEREYLRLQLEASRQFPSLTLGDLVPLPGRQQLYSGEAIPALYTRQGWEQFLRPELIKLLSTELQDETDWVLDGEGGSGVVRKAGFMREFMARYKSDYAEAWYRFLAGTGVRSTSDLESVTRQLTLFSDVQQSPLKTLLAGVNENTRWDVPEHRSDNSTAARAEDGFWQRVRGVFGSDGAQVAEELVAALPRVDDASLAGRFEAVSRLFAAENAEGLDSTIMDRYLAGLRGLKVRLNNIQRSQDVGKSSKALISETLEGAPSEIGNVRNYVETSVDTSQDALSRALRGLFIAPVQSAWNSLRGPAGQQIAIAWDKQIAAPWQRTLGHRYPMVADSGNEASVKDLQRFVDPHSGLLPTFKRNEIGNLAGGEGLGVGSTPSGAPLVNPRMLSSIDRASSLGEVIASLSDRDNGFEVMLEPAAGVTDIVFTLDGQVSHYRNGRSGWSRFVWPGESATPGARLEVVTVVGERRTVFDYPGRWGLLKMSDSAARVSDLDEVQQRFSWPVGGGQVSLLVRNFGGVKLTDLANVKSLGELAKQ